MILFLKLLVFLQVLVDFQRLLIEAGYIKWEVMEVVFGDNVTIQCTYYNRLSCTDHIFWTWTAGKENELIMTNGTLSEKYKNGKKYSERRSSCTQHSNLVISNFSEIDYRKKYKCGIANIKSTESSFVEYPKEEITFENISYEYAPAQKMVSTVLHLKDQQVFFSLKIDKIYPVPECQATFADTDVTNALKVQKMKIGLFYNVVFTYTTSEMSMTSFEDLCIRCNGKSRQWKSEDPFCKKKSDLTTESNLVDISPVEDLTTESNLVDISTVEGFYLAAIVFVGVFYILYPASILVVMIRLFYTSTRKDQFNRTKQILSGIENIAYVCIGSCFMFGILSIGGLDIQVRPELPTQLEHGLNAFSMIAFLLPSFCCISILSVILFAELKLPESISCSMFALILMIVPLSYVIIIVWMAMQDTSTMLMNRRYSDVLFFRMPIMDMLFLLFFLFSKCVCMESMEMLREKKRGGILHKETGIPGSVDSQSHIHSDGEVKGVTKKLAESLASVYYDSNSQHDGEIREGLESVYTDSNSQNDGEIRECFLNASNRQSDEEMTTYT